MGKGLKLGLEVSLEGKKELERLMDNVAEKGKELEKAIDELNNHELKVSIKRDNEEEGD